MALKDIEAIEHSVEINEFHAVHVWIWRLQYVLMGLVIASAALTLAGLFGNGWMSRTQLTESGTGITYQRFVRYENEVLLEMRLPGDVTRVAIPVAYFSRFKLDAVVPRPRGQHLQGNRVVFEFDEAGEKVVRFHLLPLKPGTSETVITAGDASFDITQFTWP